MEPPAAPLGKRRLFLAGWSRLGPLRPLLLIFLLFYVRTLPWLWNKHPSPPTILDASPPTSPPTGTLEAAAPLLPSTLPSISAAPAAPPPPLPQPAPNGLDGCGHPYAHSLSDLLWDAARIAPLAPSFHNLTEHQAAQFHGAPHFTLRRYALLASQPAFTRAAAAAAASAALQGALAARGGRAPRILLFSGSAAFWGFDGNPRTAVFGEILQWSDLWATLLHLGAAVTFAHSERGCGKTTCGCHHDGTYALRHLAHYDGVFLDYLALKWLGDRGGRQLLRAPALYLLDSFGTSPQANAMPQEAGNRAGIGLYCCEGLNLSHILTLGPTSGNAFLGSMIFPPPPASAEEAGLPQAAEEALALAALAHAAGKPPPRLLLLHGKNCAFLPPDTHPLGLAMRRVLQAFHEAGYLLLDTMVWSKCVAEHKPPNLMSLGVLGQAALRRLQGAGHVLLGVGKPLLGAQALEALVDGMAVLLPRYKLPRNCSNDEELAGKPICETWALQHPAMEGLPGVRVFDAFSKRSVRQLVQEVSALPEAFFHAAQQQKQQEGGAAAPRLLPKGYSPEDFVETVAGLLAGLPPVVLPLEGASPTATPHAMPALGVADSASAAAAAAATLNDPAVKALVAELVAQAMKGLVSELVKGVREELRAEVVAQVLKEAKRGVGGEGGGKDGGAGSSSKQGSVEIDTELEEEAEEEEQQQQEMLPKQRSAAIDPEFQPFLDSGSAMEKDLARISAGRRASQFMGL